MIYDVHEPCRVVVVNRDGPVGWLAQAAWTGEGDWAVVSDPEQAGTWPMWHASAYQRQYRVARSWQGHDAHLQSVPVGARTENFPVAHHARAWGGA